MSRAEAARRAAARALLSELSAEDRRSAFAAAARDRIAARDQAIRAAFAELGAGGSWRASETIARDLGRFLAAPRSPGAPDRYRQSIARIAELNDMTPIGARHVHRIITG